MVYGQSTPLPDASAQKDAPSQERSRRPRRTQPKIVDQLRFHQIDGLPRISWDGARRTRHIQVMSDLDSVWTTGVEVHEQIYVPSIGHTAITEPEGTFRTYSPFLTETDDGIEECDPIGARFEWWPSRRHVGVAAAVELVDGAFRISDHSVLREDTGEMCKVPAIGIILEPIQFWLSLFENQDAAQDKIVKAVRGGTRRDRNRRWNISFTEQSVAIPTIDVPDLAGIVRAWRDPQRARTYADAAPADWVPYYRSPEALLWGR